MISKINILFELDPDKRKDVVANRNTVTKPVSNNHTYPNYKICILHS